MNITILKKKNKQTNKLCVCVFTISLANCLVLGLFTRAANFDFSEVSDGEISLSMSNYIMRLETLSWFLRWGTFVGSRPAAPITIMLKKLIIYIKAHWILSVVEFIGSNCRKKQADLFYFLNDKVFFMVFYPGLISRDTKCTQSKRKRKKNKILKK